jgi:hypothetical protein
VRSGRGHERSPCSMAAQASREHMKHRRGWRHAGMSTGVECRRLRGEQNAARASRRRCPSRRWYYRFYVHGLKIVMEICCFQMINRKVVNILDPNRMVALKYLLADRVVCLK